MKSGILTALGILRYADHLGRTGKLLGVITFTDGKSLKVWSPDLHEQCKQMAKFPIGDVRYSFLHSDKWGDALATIERTQSDQELYELAREREEQQPRSHKQGGFIARQISKSVQKIVEHEREAEKAQKQGAV